MKINYRAVVVNPNASSPFVPGQSSMPTEHFYVTSLRRVDHPYIESPPSGEGQAIDPITGKVTDGQYNFRVIDVPEPVCVLSEIVEQEVFDMTTFFADGWRFKGDTQGQGFPVTTPATTVDNALGGGWWYNAVGSPGFGGSVLFFWIDDPGGPPYTLGPGARSTWMEKTFSGFTPGERVGFHFRANWTLDTGPGNIFCELNGNRVSFPNGSYDFWTIDPSLSAFVYDNYASAVADGSGNIVVKLGGEGYAASANVNCVFEEFEIVRCVFSNDPDTTASERYVTTWLADDFARQQLIDREAYIEETYDSGVTWVPKFGGYLTSLQMEKSLTFDFSVGDTRRTERNRPAFRNLTPATDANLRHLTALIGGPVYRGFKPWSPEFELPTYRIIDQQAASGTRGPNEPPDGWVRLNYIRGPLPPGFRHPGSTHAANLAYNVLNERAQKFFNPDATYNGTWPPGAFPGLRATLFSDPPIPVAYPVVELDDLVPLGQNFTVTNKVRGLGRLIPISLGIGQEFTNKGLEIVLRWGVTDTITYPTGTYLKLLITPREPNEDFPLYWKGHPVDLAALLLTRHGIAFDTTSRDDTRTALGDDLAVVLRFTKKDEKIQDILEKLYANFGFSIRVQGDGTREFIVYRRLFDSTQWAIGTDDLREEGGPTYENDNTSKKNRISLTYRYFRTVNFDDEDIMQAYDAIEEIENTQVADYSSDGGTTLDADVYGPREEQFDLNGFAAWGADAYVAGDYEKTSPMNLQQWLQAQARTIFALSARGVQYATIVTRRGVTDADSAGLADTVETNIVHIPNAQLGRSPTSQRGGTRNWRIVQRVDEIEGAKLRLADGGTGVAYGYTPTCNVRQDPNQPEFYYVLEIPDPTQYVTDGAWLEVEVTISSGVPSNSTPGVFYTTLDGNAMVESDGVTPAVPYTTILGPFPENTIAWFRLRAYLVGGTPGPWSAWTSLGGTTGNAGVFANLAVTAINATSVALAWTNTDVTNNVKVQYRPDGLGAWTDFTPILSIGATSVTVTGLSDNQLYEFRVVRWDGVAEVGTALTAFATTKPLGIASLSFSNITANEAIAQWANNNTLYDVKVEIKPASASGYSLFNVFPKGSTNCRLTNLQETTDYDVRVVLVLSTGAEWGTPLTGSFTTLTGAGTLGAPTNPKGFSGVDPASGGLSAGIYGLSVVADATNPPHEIVFEEAVETGIATDVYGAFSQVDFRPASFNGPTIWTTTTAADFKRRKLRAFARAFGWNNSPATAEQIVSPWTVRPPTNTPLFGSVSLPILGLAENAQGFEFLEFPPGAEVFKVTSVGNKSCRLRIYDSASARTADLTRDPSQLPTAGTGIFLDVILTPSNTWVQLLNPLARIIDTSGNYSPTVMTYCTVDSYDVGTNDINLLIDYQLQPSSSSGV